MNSPSIVFQASEFISHLSDYCVVVTRGVDGSVLKYNDAQNFSNMVKISLDDNYLSKTYLEFAGRTDRTCRSVDNYYAVLKTMKLTFYDNFITMRLNSGRDSVEKIGGT